jgi:hypothetical protein
MGVLRQRGRGAVYHKGLSGSFEELVQNFDTDLDNVYTAVTLPFQHYHKFLLFLGARKECSLREGSSFHASQAKKPVEGPRVKDFFLTVRRRARYFPLSIYARDATTLVNATWSSNPHSRSPVSRPTRTSLILIDENPEDKN